jgi:hypothetical protein
MAVAGRRDQFCPRRRLRVLPNPSAPSPATRDRPREHAGANPPVDEPPNSKEIAR